MNNEAASLTTTTDPVQECVSMMETISLGGEQFSVPACLLEDVIFFDLIIILAIHYN